MSVHRTLLIGEVFVDFTSAASGSPAKMRLGGIVHAARGLWASGVSYSVAAVCPNYLRKQAEDFLRAHGCKDFFWAADVLGAPNVYIIADALEIGDQGYENLLRDAKEINPQFLGESLRGYTQVIVFPGSYDLAVISSALHPGALVTIDIAYDVGAIEDLKKCAATIADITISTSSNLFMGLASSDAAPLVAACRSLGARRLLLKENRGGSRLFDLVADTVSEIPAILGTTANSVGVGDVYTAVYASSAEVDAVAAAWRGMQAATRYSQTTFPDDFRRDVRRDFRLSVQQVRALGGGVCLPWHERPAHQIYLAAPDFSYQENPEINLAVSALKYHNFSVRRPVQENGEAGTNLSSFALRHFYSSDVKLLEQCTMVFALPLGRDPGTLVEVGMALAMGKPVVTYDPRRECNNTMVICGSSTYSFELDECLNGVFEALAMRRRPAA